MRRITFIVLLISIIACAQKKQVPEQLAHVRNVVGRLDSEISSMYGWEPRDSTYNHSLDTLVAGMMNEYKADDPEYERQDEGVSAIQQQAYDEARVTWAEFKLLIDADKYEEALKLYLGEDKDNNKNSGDFLVYLKHSTKRYVFFSEVLMPLMREYKGDEYALSEYINLLKLEKAMEEASIYMQADETGYVPEVYPYVIRDLGYALVDIGKMDEAQDIFNDYINVIYLHTGDALLANFQGTKYAAMLYLRNGMTLWAIATWDNFKDYLEDNRSDYDEEELEKCFRLIQEEIDSIRNN